MLSNDTQLLVFSIGLAASLAIALVAPILRRQSDFVTTRNIFLAGAFVFSGMSGIRATYTPHYLSGYRASDYHLYFVGAIVFYAATLATYHFFKLPRRLAGRNFLRWPAVNGPVLIFLSVMLSATTVFQIVRVPIPMVGELLFQFSAAAPLIGLTCAFIAWFRAPSNPFLLGVLVATATLALFGAVNLGQSRRGLIAVLSTAPITLYWVWLRYKPDRTIVLTMVTAAAMLVPIITGFGLIRHMFNHDSRQLGATERGVALLKALPNAIKKGGSLEGFMGQDSVECALMAIHMLNNGSDKIEVDPFYSIIYAISNPIPRSLWPEKPQSFGIVLPRKSGLFARGINANLGVNVVGQCFYDGGLYIHLIYGVLVGSFLRFFDELLVREPGNPLLTGALVTMSGQLLGWPRGGIEVIGLQIAMGFFAMWGLSVLMRMLFGAGLVYPRTDHLVDFPVLRSPADWARWMHSFTAAAATANSPRPFDDSTLEAA